MSKQRPTFNSQKFLKTIGTQKTTREYHDQQAIYSQGDAADAMFHIQKGNVELSVASPRGKKAVIAILGRGDVFGEGCLGNRSQRISTATAIHPSTIARVSKGTLVRLIREEPAFAKLVIALLLSRMGRVEEAFVDRLFNSSEKRLARILILLAHLDKEDSAATVHLGINQEHLSQMVGTTRSRVSHFMNKFRALAFVDYKGHGPVTVNGGLLTVVPHE